MSFASNFDTQKLVDFVAATSNAAKTRRIIFPAGVLAGLLFYGWNSWMSRRALNNYCDDPWDSGKEIVLITGGSSGIGAEIARGFAKKNIKVIIVDVNPPVGGLGPNMFFYKLDITSTPDIEAVAAQIRTDHGHPTVLVNNAGIGTNKPILKLPEARLRATFAVNVISHFQLLSQFLPSMVSKNHGHVVTIASMGSHATQATNVDYACTKAGAMALHEGLGQELRHVYKAPKVRTTIVYPSWVRTPLIQELTESGLWNEATLEPSDIAAAVVRQVCSGYGGQIILPSSLWFIPGLRGFPLWLQEGMRDSISKILLKAR